MLLYIIFGFVLLRAYLLLKNNLSDIPVKFPEQYKAMQDNPSWVLLHEKVRAVILLMVILFFKILANQSYSSEPSFIEGLLPFLFSAPHIILLFIFIIEDARKKIKV